MWHVDFEANEKGARLTVNSVVLSELRNKMLPVKNKYKYRNDSSKSLDIIKQNGEKSGQQRQRRHRLGRKPVFDKPEILIAEAVLVIILLLFLAETLFLAIAAYLLCKYFTFIFESQRNNIDKLKKFGGGFNITENHQARNHVFMWHVATDEFIVMCL